MRQHTGEGKLFSSYERSEKDGNYILYILDARRGYTELGGIELQRSSQFFKSGSLRPFKGSPRSRASKGPLPHTLIRRNRSFSEIKITCHL